MDISYQHLNIRMSARGKRPPRNLTPTDKVRAIQRIQNGETKAAVSRDIGVPESTLRGWCKNEQKLRFMCSQTGVRTSIKKLPNSSGEISQPAEKKCRYNEQQFTIASKFLSENLTECTISPSNFIIHESPRKDYMAEGKEFLSELISRPLSKIESSMLPSFNYGQSVLIQNYLNHLALFNPDFMSVLVNFWNTTSQPEFANNKLNFIQKNLYPLENEFYTSLDTDIKGKQARSLPQNDVSSCFDFDGDKGKNWNVPNITNLNIEAEPGSDIKKSTEKFYRSRETSLQWCKIFNTNINILTSATIAAIQSAIYFQDINGSACRKNFIIGQPCENTFRSMLNNRNLDGEPEDLSMRSTTNKISTPTVSKQKITEKSVTLLPFTQNEADSFS